MIETRKYQSDCVAVTIAEAAAGNNPLMACPTAGGKTVIAGSDKRKRCRKQGSL